VEINTRPTQERITVPIAEFEKLTAERDELKRQLNELKRMLFGARSERFIPAIEEQFSLFKDLIKKTEKELEKHTIVYQREKAKKQKEQAIRSVLPAHLTRVEQIIEPKKIPANAVKIGEEITELLEVKLLTVFVRRIIRPKYALPKEQGVIIAELPSLPIPKGNASASLRAFILVSKFVDHLPLYRLLQIFKRQEVVISKSIIDGWVAQSAKLLEPLYLVFKKMLLENADYIQADESLIQVQDKIKKKTTYRGFMWVYRNPM
jgi:transposase